MLRYDIIKHDTILYHLTIQYFKHILKYDIVSHTVRYDIVLFGSIRYPIIYDNNVYDTITYFIISYYVNNIV